MMMNKKFNQLNFILFILDYFQVANFWKTNTVLRNHGNAAL